MGLELSKLMLIRSNMAQLVTDFQMKVDLENLCDIANMYVTDPLLGPRRAEGSLMLVQLA